MTKTETQKLTSIIKGYYNSQFFIDEYVISVWYEEFKDYEFQDAIDHIKKYVKEFPDTPPKPHTFKRGLLTREQKRQLANEKYFVQCKLCKRWMGMNEYDSHYGRCLDIGYLINVAKEKGENLTRNDLEHYKQDIIDRLLVKYKPVETNFINII